MEPMGQRCERPARVPQLVKEQLTVTNRRLHSELMMSVMVIFDNYDFEMKQATNAVLLLFSYPVCRRKRLSAQS